MRNLRIHSIPLTRTVAADGQCVYHNLNLVDAVVHVGHSSLKQPLSSVFSSDQHNYNSVKGPVELCIHSIPDFVLLVLGHGIAMDEQEEIGSEIRKEKHGTGIGVFVSGSDFLLGWFG